jgi:ribonuclease HII
VDRIHLGIDENGLGARLGPLIVTAVAARSVGASSIDIANRQKQDQTHLLDDSKRLVSHKDVRLGEAWARAIVGPNISTPAELLEFIGIDSLNVSTKPCPTHMKPQCWDASEERFTAPTRLVEEVAQCLTSLSERGMSIYLLRSAWVCTRVLNDELSKSRHRFVVDLHSMERLILDIRQQAGVPVHAVCGKVGGIADYPRFFGPLSGRLYTVLEQTKPRSVYEFAQLGRVTFEQDADAKNALVMIASLVGKYVRELFMARIARRYANSADVKRPPSGYHDPVTNQFVEATVTQRKSQRVPFDCFERRRNA